jgi:chromosome segregation ATPase
MSARRGLEGERGGGQHARLRLPDMQSPTARAAELRLAHPAKRAAARHDPGAPLVKNMDDYVSRLGKMVQQGTMANSELVRMLSDSRATELAARKREQQALNLNDRLEQVNRELHDRVADITHEKVQALYDFTECSTAKERLELQLQETKVKFEGESYRAKRLEEQVFKLQGAHAGCEVAAAEAAAAAERAAAAETDAAAELLAAQLHVPDLEQRIAVLSSMYDDVLARFNNVSTTHAACEPRYAEMSANLQRDCDAAKEAAKTMAQKHNFLRDELLAAIDAHRECGSRAQMNEQRVNDATQRKDVAEQRCAQLTKTLAEARGDADDVQKQVAALQSQLAALSNGNADLVSQKELLESRVRHADEAVSAEHDKVDAALQDAGAAEARLAAAAAAHADTEAKMRVLNEEMETLKDVVQKDYDAHIERERQLIKIVRSHSRDCPSALKAVKDGMRQLQMQHAACPGLQLNLQKQTVQLRSELSAMETASRTTAMTHDAEVARVRTQLDEAQTAVDTLHAQSMEV